MAFLWKCSKCGYTIVIDESEGINSYVEPLGRCPKCGTPHENFKLIYSKVRRGRP